MAEVNFWIVATVLAFGLIGIIKSGFLEFMMFITKSLEYNIFQIKKEAH